MLVCSYQCMIPKLCRWKWSPQFQDKCKSVLDAMRGTGDSIVRRVDELILGRRWRSYWNHFTHTIFMTYYSISSLSFIKEKPEKSIFLLNKIKLVCLIIVTGIERWIHHIISDSEAVSMILLNLLFSPFFSSGTFL